MPYGINMPPDVWPPQPGPPQPQDMMQQQPPVQMPTGAPMPQQVSTLTPQGQVGFEPLQGPQPGAHPANHATPRGWAVARAVEARRDGNHAPTYHARSAEG